MEQKLTKKTIKIVIFSCMIAIFLILFFIFSLVIEANATAGNTKKIKDLEQRIEKLEKNSS